MPDHSAVFTGHRAVAELSQRGPFVAHSSLFAASHAATEVDGTLDTAAYREAFAAVIGDSLLAFLTERDAPTGSAFVTFNGTVAGAIVAASGAALTAKLDGLLGKHEVNRLIDGARALGREQVGDGTRAWIEDTAHSGPGRWFPDITVALGTAMHALLRQSLDRIVPRYIRAAVATGLAAEEAIGQTLAAPPPPRAIDIVASHTIDVLTIAALIDDGRFGYRSFRNAYPEERGRRGTLRPLTIQWAPRDRGTCWARVIAPSDPAIEEVAHAVFGSSLRTPDILVAASPLFGLNNLEALLPEHRAAVAALAGPVGTGDGTVHLVDGPFAEEIAKNQAGPYVAAGATKVDVLSTLTESLAIVRTIEHAGASFGMGKNPAVSSMETLTARLQQRREHLATVSEADAVTWAAQARAQQQVLTAVSFGLDREAKRLAGMTAMLDGTVAAIGGLTLPPHVRNAMNHVAMGYADVALISDAAQSAAARLAVVAGEAAALPITFLEGTLVAIQRTLDDARNAKHSAADHAEYGVPAMNEREQALKLRLAQLRATINTDPDGAAKELAEIGELIEDLQIETECVGTMDQIDGVWAALDEASSIFTWESTDRRLRYLKVTGEVFHDRWRHIFAQAKSNDVQQRASAREQLRELRADEGFASWLGSVRDAIEDAQVQQLIGKLAALIAITIITSGMGNVAAMAMLGATESTIAAVATGAVVEAAASTALSQALIDDNHDAGHIAYEAGANLVLAGAGRIFNEIAAARNVGKLKTISGALLTTTALGFVKAELDAYLKHGRPMNADELGQFALQAVATAVATHAIAPKVQPLFDAVEGAAYSRALKARIHASDGVRQWLVSRVQRLPENPSEADVIDYATREVAWANDRLKILDEIEAIAAHDPETDGSPSSRRLSRRLKLSSETIAELRRELTTHVADSSRQQLPLLLLEPKGAGLFTCPREHIDTVVTQIGTVTQTTTDPLTHAVSYDVTLRDGSSARVIERVDPAADWISQLRTLLTPGAYETLQLRLRSQTPAELMRRYQGSFDVAMRELDSGAPLPLLDTVEMYCTGEVPRDPGTRLRYGEIGMYWPAHRRALHDALIARARAQALQFADAVQRGQPTLYAMRGNTAAGKTRAVTTNVAELAGPMHATRDLQHRSVNPDNFKQDLIEASGGRLTSQQVHAESSMLANRLEHDIRSMRTSDGKELASILIDKRLATLNDVLSYAELARETNRKFVLYDVDAPLQTSLAGVLERVGGQSDPLPNYDVVGNGFTAIRYHRRAVIAAFENDPSLGRYELYGARDDGARVPVATIENGALRVHDDALFTAATSRPGDMSDYLASVRLTDDVISILTDPLPADRRVMVAAILRKYQGWTWKAALDAHSSQRPPLQPDVPTGHQGPEPSEPQPPQPP